MGLAGTRGMVVAAGITAAATLAVDQATKHLAQTHLEPGTVRTFDRRGWFGVAHYRNPGIAYGMLKDMPVGAAAVITAGLACGALAMGRTGNHKLLAGVGAGLLLGGGLGNLSDRVRHGAVIDIATATPLFGYFNLADVALAAGVGVTALAMMA